MAGQIVVFATLLITLILFIANWWRYDVVALIALFVLVLFGVVPGAEAFAGFGHPAVITVAAVLVISRGLLYSGVVDSLARSMGRIGGNLLAQMLAMTALVTFFSAFMNNIGALALFMPVALRVAGMYNRPASIFLMPMAFASLLGGMATMIGTPPNIIIAMARAEAGGEPFRMFDFTPVGLVVAVVGIIFIAFVGWRLIPRRAGIDEGKNIFNIEEYITEVRVPGDSRYIGMNIRDLVSQAQADVVVVSLVRNHKYLPAPSSFEILSAGDILIVEADSDALQEFVGATGLELVGSKKLGTDALGSADVALVEVVIMPGSALIGRTARSLNLRWRYGINLLAVARQRERLRTRLGSVMFRAGDILLLQGRLDTIQDTINVLGCLPLAQRELRLGQQSRIFLASIIFGAGLLATALGLLPVQISLAAVALGMVLAGFLSLRRAYESIEWPVIILLGALIPMGQALQDTGGADILAGQLLKISSQMPPVVTLGLLVTITLLLSNVINNAAAALLMAPIAVSVAAGLGAAVDPFLMGVAIGASASFLTPIGHQSSLLVMGPGGYHFGDYWRLGLPLSVLVLLVALPVIVRVWPLF